MQLASQAWARTGLQLHLEPRLQDRGGSARRSKQSVLKEINPQHSLEGLMLRLKLQYSDHLMGRAGSLEKTLMLGKTEGGKRRGRQRMRWLDGTTYSMDMCFGKSGS